MHPASNFMGHYLLAPLAARGVACLGLNSRYPGSDTLLLMKRVIQDLGAGIAYLRERGYMRLLLVGNSGGAALGAYHAAQSQALTATHFVHGEPKRLVRADLPPIDGIALCAAHEGRSRLLARWIDPALSDEQDLSAVDPALNLYGPTHRPPYGAAFLARFAAAQAARLARIEAWVDARLQKLRDEHGAASPAADQVFTVHRTHADQSTFPSTRDAWLAAAPGRIRNIDIRGGNHYLARQPARVEQVAEEIATFAESLSR